ncbi:uncharacterized protein LOC124366305 [Homalodisca vitripennis]|uniref:Uncharacterized protein n=1 Tax=Homalodisca liturata TaxID=320908 RepID=A0A1B6HHM8_9HEMI|nr:uncharacterized protein LOC124366305 [Homalodisca vitripennis]
MVSSVIRLSLAAVLLVTVVSSASVEVSKRAVSSESTSNSSDDKECHPANPCGWAVYIPFTRTVDYFMKNTCVCPKGKSCLRTDDDLSVSAYVYRCRVEANPSESDTEPPAATT